MTVFAPELINATIDDYPIIQNMARFYVYDMSRYCGFISEDWASPEDGLYECLDFNGNQTKQRIIFNFNTKEDYP